MAVSRPAPVAPPTTTSLTVGALAVEGDSGSAKPHGCKQCPRTYTTAYWLRAHVQAKHDGKTHSCEQCEKVYTWEGDLKEHKRDIHGEEKGRRFSCPNPNCDKSFSKKRNLMKHCRNQKKRNPTCIEFLLDLDEAPETLSHDAPKSGNSAGGTSDIRERNAIVRGDAGRDAGPRNEQGKESCNMLNVPVERSILVKDKDAEVITTEQRTPTRTADSTPVSSLSPAGLDEAGDERMLNEDSEMSDNLLNDVGAWIQTSTGASANTNLCPDVELYTNASIAAKALKTREASWITLATERAADSVQKTAMVAPAPPNVTPQTDDERFNRLNRYFINFDWYLHSLTYRLDENMDMSSDMTSDSAS